MEHLLPVILTMLITAVLYELARYFADRRKLKKMGLNPRHDLETLARLVLEQRKELNELSVELAASQRLLETARNYNASASKHWQARYDAWLRSNAKVYLAVSEHVALLDRLRAFLGQPHNEKEVDQMAKELTYRHDLLQDLRDKLPQVEDV
jgi:predicted Holliday junction resolvase-like endonuclease